MSGVVADLYANFYANTAPLKTGLDSAGGMLKKFGSTLSAAGLGGVAPFLTTAGAIAGVTKVVTSALKKTAEYSDQIRELTRNTGMSVEQSAKMLQVADDSQVSFGSLTTAMKYAIKDGVLPNIEGIAKLSDEYLALQDPLLRSQMLINQFGRNGLEMSKIMELGSTSIMQTAENAEKFGMVMSTQEIAKMRAYEMAVNNMQTAVKGLGIQLAIAFAPPLAGLFNGLADGIAKSTEATKFFARAGSDAYVEGRLVQMGMLSLDEAVYRLNPKLRETGYWLDDEGNAISNLIPKVEGLVGVMGQLGGVQPSAPNAPTLPEAGAFKGGIKQLTGELMQGKEAGAGSQFIQPLLDKINALPPASRTAANSFRADAMTIMESARVASGEIKMTDAARELADNLNISTTEATKKIKGVGNSVMAINGLSAQVDIYVVTHYISVGGSKYIDYKAGGESEILKLGRKSAKGDNFIVPNGYENDSYPMLVSSGERVIVIPKNKVNQIPKMRYGTGEGSSRREPGDWGGSGSGGSPLNNLSGVWGSVSDLGGSVMGGGENMLRGAGGILGLAGKMFMENTLKKSVENTVMPLMSGLITSQTAKAGQQISAITSKLSTDAGKNVMISQDVIMYLERIWRGIERLPVDVRDAVLMAR